MKALVSVLFENVDIAWRYTSLSLEKEDSDTHNNGKFNENWIVFTEDVGTENLYLAYSSKWSSNF